MATPQLMRWLLLLAELVLPLPIRRLPLPAFPNFSEKSGTLASVRKAADPFVVVSTRISSAAGPSPTLLSP